MKKAEIFTLNKLPVIGEMGDQTNLEIKTICDVCKRKHFVYSELEYCFDRWNGEDLIEGFDFILVSEKIKNLLKKNKIKGITYLKIISSKKAYFKLGKKAYQKELPCFYKITINERVKGPEIWYTKAGVCSNCQDQKWDETIEGINSLIEEPAFEYVQRKVYYNDWKEQDIFKLHDPGPPIITKCLLDVFKNNSLQKINFKKADWI